MKYILRALVLETFNLLILLLVLFMVIVFGLVLYTVFDSYVAGSCILILVVVVQVMIVYEKAQQLKQKDKYDEQ